MKLPIDTSRMDFTCSLAAEPVMDFETKQPKLENGEPLFSMQVVAFTDEGAQIMVVKALGTPPASIKQGTPLKITNLVASNWSMDGRSGLAFRAARIEPLTAGATAKAGQ
jgi:hypothetical protein